MKRFGLILTALLTSLPLLTAATRVVECHEPNRPHVHVHGDADHAHHHHHRVPWLGDEDDQKHVHCHVHGHGHVDWWLPAAPIASRQHGRGDRMAPGHAGVFAASRFTNVRKSPASVPPGSGPLSSLERLRTVVLLI